MTTTLQRLCVILFPVDLDFCMKVKKRVETEQQSTAAATSCLGPRQRVVLVCCSKGVLECAGDIFGWLTISSHAVMTFAGGRHAEVVALLW